MKGARFAAALLLAAICLACATSSPASDLYVGAAVDSAGAVRVTTHVGRVLAFPRKDDQVELDDVAISPDSQSVGWLAYYPNVATSYPIPLKLIICTGGKLREYTGSGLPVWRWAFFSGGKNIGFEQETVHGSQGIHYELHEVRSGRLIAEFTPAPGADTLAELADRPKWTRELDKP